MTREPQMIEPRTIARIIELFHIPIQHSPETLRDVYQEISSSCGYDNFIRVAGGARLESAATEGGTVSRLTFSKDRIGFHEERSDGSLESLLRRVEAVIAVATEKLSIPIFIARNLTLRAIASPPRGLTSSEFVAQNLVRVEPEDFQPLGRPGQVVGLRFHFPPTEPKGGTHQVRIESYLRDPRMLYLEDWATFKVPVQSRDHRKISAELQEVEEFLHERLCSFLSQFPR